MAALGLSLLKISSTSPAMLGSCPSMSPYFSLRPARSPALCAPRERLRLAFDAELRRLARGDACVTRPRGADA